MTLRSGQLGARSRPHVVIERYTGERGSFLVQVDGAQHRLRRAADARRDAKLARLGYRVLRLEAGLVMRQLPVAPRRVREALAR